MPTTMSFTEFVPLARAADSLRLSPKTLQKRLQELDIEPTVDPDDRRIKLLSRDQIEMVREKTRKSVRVVDAVRSLARRVRSIGRRLTDVEEELPRHQVMISTLDERISQSSQQVTHLEESVARLEKRLDQALGRVIFLEGLQKHARYNVTETRAVTTQTQQPAPASQSADDPDEDREPATVR